MFKFKILIKRAITVYQCGIPYHINSMNHRNSKHRSTFHSVFSDKEQSLGDRFNSYKVEQI